MSGVRYTATRACVPRKQSPRRVFDYTDLLGSKRSIDFDYTSIDSEAWVAGAMVSSAGDLHKLFTVLVNGELISAESFAEMTDADEYGLGLMTDYRCIDDSLIGHSGGLFGYTTLALHSPETGQAALWVAADEDIEISRTYEDVADRIAG